MRVLPPLAIVVAFALMGCVREARIHLSGQEIQAVKNRPVWSVQTEEGVFSGVHMKIVAIENDDGTKQNFRPHVGLDTAVHQASEKGSSIVVRQTDYTTTSEVGQTMSLIALVILGGVSQVLSYGAIATTRDLIKTPFDQAWYRTTFVFGVGVATVGLTGGILWLTSRIRFLRHTNLGEGKLR
jgi:hypothetical protein